ncbi:D-alanyl-D-alanine carboxypeptidase family protein [Paenibacillus rigui]|uniref:D-alanyl-D-alanine carboxypeptidase family protein n=1 Tax=Paenibacillus rigui TaxID=554312 RepID=UPI001FEAED6B|nr:D-alanyl-D-alanine carboxypeptidase family protein [Paenibacillus rigui]
MLLSVRRVAVIVTLAIIVQLGTALWIQPNKAEAAEAVDLKLDVKSAILIEASTGQVLYENNADAALPPASMAKMMTEYLVMEAVKSGKIKWEDMVQVSQYSADVIGSGDLLAVGEQYTVKDLFGAMSIYSANDASVALAEFIAGGSEENFAKMMNEKAKEMGLSNQAHFISSTGLSRVDLGKYAPKGIEGETLLTAKDAAIIAYNILKDHKEVLDFTKQPSKKFREKDKAPMINWNWMLEGNKDNVNFKKYAYPGLDGLKTGSTDDAGYCFTGTAERNGMRLISVVMGTKTEPKRFEETRKVLDYGFNNFEMKQVLTAKAEIDSLKTVNIKKGVETQVPVVTQTGLSIVAKKGATPDQFVITAEPADESKLVAPIAKGAVVGTVKVTYQGTEKTANLIANEDVEKGSWFRLFFRAIKDFFVDTISGKKK